jgi:hypothetical protein
LLSALSKILEKAVCSQLKQWLNKEKLFCPTQYGFRYKSSTTHAVQDLMNHITQNAAQDKSTVATFIDLSKAFDCLQYDKLFSKMDNLGIRNETLAWFKDYLTDREQCVELDGVRSQLEKVQLGVPQGSILGPVLFLIYVNDINSTCPDADLVKFADDTTLITTGDTTNLAIHSMNSSLSKISRWFIANKLQLNPSKTRYMLFNNKNENHIDVEINGKKKVSNLLGFI